MAKRSDFAQKLLDDLRIRKERMATTQSSNRSKTTTIDAYAYSKQIHRGSKNTKTHGMKVSNTGKVNTARHGEGSKRLMIEDKSNQIVPYTRGRNSEQIGDLSMALAFALENGGKLRNNSSGNNLMFGFLQQIGRGSFEIGKMNKRGVVDRLHNSSGYIPSISQLHIKEISRGAQKLNQILRTCSNGLNFGRCSIEIGQELLKGAMDLEESLRMLVNLHEASEHMISPQQKNRIVLLEDEDGEENKVERPDQKQLVRPRFSLDQLSLNSRSSREFKGNDLKQKLANLRYTADEGNFNQDERVSATVKLSYHRKSASYGCDIKSASTSDRVGIPNVIAKLMGLDSLQDMSNYTHQDIATKQKVGQKNLQPTVRGHTKNAEPKTINKECPSNLKKPKLTESAKNSSTVNMNSVFSSQVMNNFPKNEASFQAVEIYGKPSWKLRPETSPPIITTVKKEDKNETRQTATRLKGYQEKIRKEHQLKQRETVATGRDEKREVLQNGLQQKDSLERNTKQHQLKYREPRLMVKDEKKREVSKTGGEHMEAKMDIKSENTTILQGYKKRTLQLEKVHPTNKLQSSKQQKTQSRSGFQQPFMLHKEEIREVKYNREERKQKIGKQKVQDRNPNSSVTMSKTLTESARKELNLQKKQKDMNLDRKCEKNNEETIAAHYSNVLPENRCVKNPSCEDSCYDDEREKTDDRTHRCMEHSFSSRDSEAKLGKEDFLIQPVIEKQHANVFVNGDVKSTKLQKSERPINNREEFAQIQKSQKFQEMQHNRHDKLNEHDTYELLDDNNGSNEVEDHIVESKNTVVNIHPQNSTEDPHMETKQDLTLSLPAEDGCLNLKEQQISSQNANDMQSQKTILVTTSKQQDQMLTFGRDEVNSSKIVVKAVEEADRNDMNILYPPHLEHLHSFSKSRKQEMLTESENHLKHTLITNEKFLNAAEAIFKLNIPGFILHDSNHNHNHLKDSSNFTIDCSYEIMKRKGLRQELSNHPCTNIFIRPKKIGSLDDLIKHLHKDFETLKLYGRNGRIECEAQDYLPKMIEIDICNQEPDLNSMWDLGWNETIFTFLEREEVVRNVEKHILSGLLDEVFRDLLSI